MFKLNLILKAILLIIIFFQYNCDNKDKWKALPLKITKYESYNYSEMISGELDSSAKNELEVVKKITSNKIKEESKKNNEKISLSQKFKNIINWLKNFFNY